MNELSKLSRASATLVLCASSFALAGQETRVATPGVQHVAVQPITKDEAGGLIHLDVVVTDPSGAPVSGLHLEDFTLQDNGQPEKILTFDAFDGTATRPDPPSRIILVIDDIDRQDDPKLGLEIHLAVEHYLRKYGGHLRRPVSVYLINGLGLWTVAHPEGDGNAIADDIVNNQLRSIRRFIQMPVEELTSTVVPDTAAMSVLKSIGQIATEERRRPGRKLLVWVGRGESMGRGLYEVRKTMTQDTLDTICWFSLLLREARIVLYTLTVGEHSFVTAYREDSPRLKGEDYLHGAGSPEKASYMSWDRKVLALQSGGRVLEGSYVILQQIESCVREADVFYTLTFDPSHADASNEYHDLKVLVNKPGLTARTNAGYYDQPWYAVDRYPAAHSVTVKQLEQMLAADRSASDAELARQLAALELSEQLSETKASALLTASRGKRTREALRILADASVFLNPPADEIPAAAPPEPDAQRRMLSLTAEYLSTTIHKLPNYLARQTIVRYQETPQLARGSIDTWTRPLHVTDTLNATIYYRNGSEVAEPAKPRGRREKADDPQLATYGTFGPVLAALRDAIQRPTDMAWNRWEQSPAGPVAVFRYTIPAETSRYQAKACCLPDGDGRSAFLHYVGFHGEIAIDPRTGTVIRLELSADLKSTTPVVQSRIMIEYGPVDIGGTKYVCPVRSISMMRARSVAETSEWDESFLTYGPYATMLNEIEFSNYRVFRSTARMLPGFTPAPGDK
jgi:VWFA-related protein